MSAQYNSSGSFAGSAPASAGYGSASAWGSQPSSGASAAYGQQSGFSAAYGQQSGVSASFNQQSSASAGYGSAPSAGYISRNYAAGQSTANYGNNYNNNGNRSAFASQSGSQFRGASNGGAAAATSQIEQQVINAKQPIQTSEREQITAGQFRGIYLNKSEAAQFRGPIPLEQYQINNDPNPEVIRKRLDKVKYTQEVSVRYLQPPLPPKPGNLIIRERQSTVPPAPPVVIRQEGQGASTPAPLVLRERPPQAPARIPEQVVEVEGAPIAPPARRVVFEKLSNLPPKPQNVVVEKWLPYQPQKRRVIYEKAQGQAPQNPRNLIIEWEAPEVEVEKVCKDLGVVEADPEEYIRRYGNELKDASELPDCGDSNNSCGGGSRRQGAAAAAGNGLPELEGDVQALRLVNLEQYGLGAYRSQIGH